MCHRSVSYQNRSFPGKDHLVSVLPQPPQRSFSPAVKSTSSRNIKTVPTSTTQTHRYHLLSLNDVHEDGIGRPIIPGAHFFVPDCPVIHNYVKQLKVSERRVLRKCLPPILKDLPSNKRIDWGKYTALTSKQYSSGNSIISETALTYKQYSSGNSMISETAPKYKQYSSGNSMISETASTFKQSMLEHNIKPKTVPQNNHNYFRGYTSLPKTISPPKHINYQHYKVPNTSPTNKFISGIIISEIVPNSKQINCQNDFKEEFVVPECVQLYSGSSIIEETHVPSYKQNYCGKHTAQTSTPTSKQIVQIFEISAGVGNENRVAAKSKSTKPCTQNQAHSTTPQLHQHERRYLVHQAKSPNNSRKQTKTAHEATNVGNSMSKEFNPHPYDDSASRDQYVISCKNIPPGAVCFGQCLTTSDRRLPTALPKRHKRKQKRKKVTGSQMSRPENGKAFEHTYKIEHNALLEKQKELLEILTSLSADITPQSCPPPRLRRKRRRRKVVHSVARCRVKRFHQLSGWQTEGENQVTCQILPSAHRWRKKRAKRVKVRLKKLQVIGRAILPACSVSGADL